MTTSTHSHKDWTDKGGHVKCSDSIQKLPFPRAHPVRISGAFNGDRLHHLSTIDHLLEVSGLELGLQ
jgi:hypothetical protein